MSDDAFLRAIRAEPNEDTPRLIYADWLEERGDPRAELIRVQCELARVHPAIENRAALQQREQHLLRTYSSALLGPGLQSWAVSWTFSRGLPTNVTVRPGAFRSSAAMVQILWIPHVSVDLTDAEIDAEVIELLHSSITIDQCLVPLAKWRTFLVVASDQPVRFHDEFGTLRDDGMIGLLRDTLKTQGKRLLMVHADLAQINHVLRRHYQIREPDRNTDFCLNTDKPAAIEQPPNTFSEVVFEDEAKLQEATRTVESFILDAISQRAREIQIEPLADAGRVRFHLRRGLVEVEHPSSRIVPMLVAATLRMAGIDPKQRGQYPKGRIEWDRDGVRHDLTVSARFGRFGTAVVIRFNESASK